MMIHEIYINIHVPSCSFIFHKLNYLPIDVMSSLKQTSFFHLHLACPKKDLPWAGAQGAGHRRSLVEGGPRARKGARPSAVIVP